MADPQRYPLDATRALFAPIGTLTDKLRVAFKGRGGYDLSKHGDSLSSIEALRADGFSERIIDCFFRPFLGGVFQEKALSTSVQKLDFVMNHFSNDDTAIPAHGMAEIPRQLADQLAGYQFRFQTTVSAIEGKRIHLVDGSIIEAESIVIATDAYHAARLLQIPGSKPQFHSSSCFYFRAKKIPSRRPILWLNAEDSGPINHFAVVSNVSQHYAPEGQHLIAASVIDPASLQATDLLDQVQKQLFDWFGAMTQEWSLLRVDHISRSVPVQKQVAPPNLEPRPGIYQCGAHQGIASIETALSTGVQVAQRIIQKSNS